MWYLKVRTRPCACCLAAAGMEPRVMSKRNVTQKGKFLLLVRGNWGGGGVRMVEVQKDGHTR